MAQIVTSQPGTTVVVQQTQVVRDWNSGVFSCLDDIGSCKLTVFYLCFFLSYPCGTKFLRALIFAVFHDPQKKLHRKKKKNM